MELVLGWLAFAVVAGIVASSRGRSGLGYFALSVVLSPLVGLILALALPNLRLPDERRGDPADLRDCPHCAEPIRRAAILCRYCGQGVDPLAAPVAARRGDSRALVIGAAVIAILVVVAAVTRFRPENPAPAAETAHQSPR